MAKTKVIASRNQQSNKCNKKSNKCNKMQDASNGTESEPKPAAGETLYVDTQVIKTHEEDK